MFDRSLTKSSTGVRGGHSKVARKCLRFQLSVVKAFFALILSSLLPYVFFTTCYIFLLLLLVFLDLSRDASRLYLAGTSLFLVLTTLLWLIFCLLNTAWYLLFPVPKHLLLSSSPSLILFVTPSHNHPIFQSHNLRIFVSLPLNLTPSHALFMPGMSLLQKFLVSFIIACIDGFTDRFLPFGNVWALGWIDFIQDI